MDAWLDIDHLRLYSIEVSHAAGSHFLLFRCAIDYPPEQPTRKIIIFHSSYVIAKPARTELSQRRSSTRLLLGLLVFTTLSGDCHSSHCVTTFRSKIIRSDLYKCVTLFSTITFLFLRRSSQILYQQKRKWISNNFLIIVIILSGLLWNRSYIRSISRTVINLRYVGRR